MGLIDLFRTRAEPEDDAPHQGYYALDERIGARPAYDDWDERLAAVDTGFRAAIDRDRRDRARPWSSVYWSGRRKRWWAVRIIAAMLAVFILLVAYLAITAPLNKSLRPIAPPQITLLASDGTPIARNGAMTDEPVDVETLPPHVVNAFLSIEDRRFYDHWGLDPRGIGRAVFTGRGGGSTITQQLAKFTFLNSERTMTRKAREALIAFWLEGWLTKDEILERYLSNAYFGDNVYGLRAASLHFFYRKPENLKVEQAAMLAGLLQAPSRYNPAKHYERAEARWRTVVGAMVAAGHLSEAEAARLRPPALDIRLKSDVPTGTYFADWALPEARERAEGGYDARQTLTTTLDSRLQTAARQITERRAPAGAQVALVAMRPNGEVVAMVGGTNYAKTPFNRATQAQRQPGSTFKLFVYLAALREGWDMDDRIANTPIEQGSYRPKNARGRYSESLSLKDAFAQSSNVAAVRLMQEVGSENVIATARDLGVRAPMTKGDPTLALGTANMSLLELTAAYAGIAGNGFPVEPHAFVREKPGWWDGMLNRPERLSSRVHGEMEELLRASINEGTGRAAMLSGANFGKTGTTQDNRDALFVGYAGGLVVGVWIGRDDNGPLDGVSGGGLPAQIWRDFMQAAGAAPVPKPPVRQRDPGGPVQPQDVPDLEDIPLGDDRSRLRIRDGQATISTDIDGIPVEVDIDESGMRVNTDQLEEILRRRERELEELER